MSTFALSYTREVGGGNGTYTSRVSEMFDTVDEVLDALILVKERDAEIQHMWDHADPRYRDQKPCLSEARVFICTEIPLPDTSEPYNARYAEIEKIWQQNIKWGEAQRRETYERLKKEFEG